MLIGVLALQGDVREHVNCLDSLGADVRLVKSPKDLQGLDGIVLPGGESTTQSKLLEIFGLFEPLREALEQGMPVLGTCAGLILLSSEVEGLADGQRTLGVLDVKVSRNAYGSQLDSFESTLEFNSQLMQVAFIRAPRILESKEATVLATFQGEPVVVRSGTVFGATCHPEILGDHKLHAAFLEVCRSKQ